MKYHVQKNNFDNLILTLVGVSLAVYYLQKRFVYVPFEYHYEITDYSK